MPGLARSKNDFVIDAKIYNKTYLLMSW